MYVLLFFSTLFLQKEVASQTKFTKLVWADEFNYKGLPDSSKWNYDIGGNGWGNNELQYYTANDTLNAIVVEGVLKITARRQVKENRQYTSARLQTKNKASFKYGKIEVRAKLPAGRGTWPAIWMLGENIGKEGWPRCGEIDIMEHVGYDPNKIHSSVHTYSIEWTPDKIDFMVDGVIYNHFINEHLTTKEWPFDQPFYLILNLAVGGNWGGKKGVDESVFPATLEVDYVRVFQTR